MAGISTQMLLAINHGYGGRSGSSITQECSAGKFRQYAGRPEGSHTYIASRRERRKLSTVKTGSDPCVRTLTGCWILILPPLFLAPT
jgi:hypothetical protein